MGADGCERPLLVDRATGAAYAHATGLLDKTGALAPRWEPPVSIAPITQNLLLDPASTGVNWITSDPRDFGGEAVLKYRLQGGEACKRPMSTVLP